MYHYDPATALEELNDDAVLPNPVHLRDMLLARPSRCRPFAGIQSPLRRLSEALRRIAESRQAIARSLGRRQEIELSAAAPVSKGENDETDARSPS